MKCVMVGNDHPTCSGTPTDSFCYRIYSLMPSECRMSYLSNHTNSLEEGGTETILVAEDNKEVRKMIRGELEKFGYNIIEAVDGEDAVKVFKKKKKEIQLVLLDVIMPKKNGKIAYDEIKKEKPGIKHIFMSGYSKDILDSKGIVSEEIHYLFKPVSIFELLRILRKVLDG